MLRAYIDESVQVPMNAQCAGKSMQQPCRQVLRIFIYTCIVSIYTYMHAYIHTYTCVCVCVCTYSYEYVHTAERTRARGVANVWLFDHRGGWRGRGGRGLAGCGGRVCSPLPVQINRLGAGPRAAAIMAGGSLDWCRAMQGPCAPAHATGAGDGALECVRRGVGCDGKLSGPGCLCVRVGGERYGQCV